MGAPRTQLEENEVIEVSIGDNVVEVKNFEGVAYVKVLSGTVTITGSVTVGS